MSEPFALESRQPRRMCPVCREALIQRIKILQREDEEVFLADLEN